MAGSNHQPAGDISDSAAEHVRQSVSKYKVLFLGLMALTLITVGLSYVDFGSAFWNVVVALLVASLKAGLVAAVFMHLWGERATVWKVLVFTVVFAVGLFGLSYLHFSDPIGATTHSSRGAKDFWAKRPSGGSQH
jgi:caa(3)-type oxidase subunit IV